MPRAVIFKYKKKIVFPVLSGVPSTAPNRGMLPLPRQHFNDRECPRRAQVAPQARQTFSGGGLQCQPVGDGGQPEERVYCGGYGNGWS